MIRSLMVVAALLGGFTDVAAGQDATKGANVFKQCGIYHAIGAAAQNKIGPELNRLDVRHSGRVADFSYSNANKNSGIVWSEATFKQYIADPRAKSPGTKMPFAGLKDPQQINDVWAFIKQFNADGSTKN